MAKIDGALLIIREPPFEAKDRAKAHKWVDAAPVGSRINYRGPKRTVPQNDLWHACLTDIAEQLTWHGRKWLMEDWKDYMKHALRRGRWMPGEDGEMVPIGLSSADFSAEEMSDVIEITFAFGARHGVSFRLPKPDRPR